MDAFDAIHVATHDMPVCRIRDLDNNPLIESRRQTRYPEFTQVQPLSALPRETTMIRS